MGPVSLAFLVFFLMIRRPPRSTLDRSSAASDVYKRQVLGGRGHSASADGSPATTFANNDGWHDDTSDGPVHATVKLGGVALPVDSAWVLVCLLYTSPSPRDRTRYRMPSSA